MKAQELSGRKVHPIASIVFMVLGLAVLAGSIRYEFGSFDNPGAGLFPFFTGLAMASFAAVDILQSLRRGWNPIRGLWEGTHWHRALLVAVALILFSAFLQDLGFLLTTFIVMGFCFRLLDRSSWAISLFATLATTFGFYIVFNIWLKSQLPTGIFGF